MTELKKLLDQKKEMKKKKPEFIRQEYNKRKRLPKKWRRPRGIQSKLRLRRKGKPARVSIGYGTPKKVRHFTLDGFKKVIVNNIKELKEIKEKEIAVIARTVGERKKLAILKEAQKLGLKIYNFPKIKEAIEKIEEKHKKKPKKEKKEKTKEEKPKEETHKVEDKAKEEKPKEVKDESKTPKKASEQSSKKGSK